MKIEYEQKKIVGSKNNVNNRQQSEHVIEVCRLTEDYHQIELFTILLLFKSDFRVTKARMCLNKHKFFSNAALSVFMGARNDIFRFC